MTKRECALGLSVCDNKATSHCCDEHADKHGVANVQVCWECYDYLPTSPGCRVDWTHRFPEPTLDEVINDLINTYRATA
jgi:hypothetical protein